MGMDMAHAACGQLSEWDVRAARSLAQLAFVEDMSSVGWAVFNYVVDTLFILDIFINFRTGYIVGGHYVDDPWLAAVHYFFDSFAIDFIGSFPLNMIFDIDW